MKTILKWIAVFIIAFSTGISVSNGQEHLVDSLRNAVRQGKEDTNKMYALKALSWSISFSNADTALKLDTEYLRLAEKLSTSSDKAVAAVGKRGIAGAYYYSGVFNMHKSNFEIAMENADKALSLYSDLGYEIGVGSAYTSKGIIYKEEGQYPKAIDYFFKALAVDEKLKNSKKIGTDLGNIGVIYNRLKENTKALDYYGKALKIARENNDKMGQERTLSNMATIYSDMLEYNEALDSYMQSVKIAEEIDDEYQMSTTMIDISVAYSGLAHKKGIDRKLKDSLLAESLRYTLKSLDISRKIGLKGNIAINLVNAGSDYGEQGKFKEGEQYLLDAIAISDSINAQDTKSEAYKSLSELYTSRKDYAKALEAYKKYSTIKDSVFNSEKNKEVTRNEVNYEFDKKEAVIKGEQDKKDLIAAEEKKKQNIIFYAVSVGLILVLLLAAFIFRGYRQKQKANQLLEDRNRTIKEQKAKVDQAFGQLNEKHKEVTDSINYAKRIQQALFKDEEYVTRHLPEHYILFKPRDVVSGDFYWGFQKNNKWFVAAVDCTGHGVPGAFLTMLGSAFLNEICTQPADISPAEVLNQLREKVVKELSAQGEVKDGMDISLCCIPMGSGQPVKVEWAGANNPLWYVQNGEMKEIVADKQPIGYYETQKPFSNHILQLNKGDMIYLFTDGYADQFGGERGKKYKYKQLNDKLKEIHKNPMQEQKMLLNREFETWKGGLEQTDDVCVIGIRI